MVRSLHKDANCMVTQETGIKHRPGLTRVARIVSSMGIALLYLAAATAVAIGSPQRTSQTSPDRGYQQLRHVDRIFVRAGDFMQRRYLPLTEESNLTEARVRTGDYPVNPDERHFSAGDADAAVKHFPAGLRNAYRAPPQ